MLKRKRVSLRESELSELSNVQHVASIIHSLTFPMSCSINGTTMPLISNLDLIRLIQENGGDVK